YVAARPGTSNHGWGTAIDMPETYDYSFRGKYFKWLKANSKNYNWVHRKILEEDSPYAEAWHFDYVGR
ncbi:MAG: M15 family metallopeptidase, partial [Paeniglutamicibacter terrestris]